MLASFEARPASGPSTTAGSTQPDVFLHALARFRSAQPLHEVELWNQRHAWDLALALRKSAWMLDGRLPDLALIFRRAGELETVAHICILRQGEAVDIFGSNVSGRLEEGEFEENVTWDIRNFDSTDTALGILEQEFMLSYWPPEPDFGRAIESGIQAAAIELAPSSHRG